MENRWRGPWTSQRVNATSFYSATVRSPLCGACDCANRVGSIRRRATDTTQGLLLGRRKLSRYGVGGQENRAQFLTDDERLETGEDIKQKVAKGAKVGEGFRGNCFCLRLLYKRFGS